MPNNIITKEWMDANDAAIQKKLQPLKDVKVVRVLSEAPQSWESLLTYTLSNNTYSFKPGDEVRVPDNDASTGYTYYKLHKVENNTATWEAIGESSASQMCSITVTITSDGNTEPEGMSFTVTDNQGNVFGTGLSGETVMVPIGTNYTVSGSEVEGYQAEPVQGTASDNSVSVTLEYVKRIVNGVFAYYSDGSLRDLEHADSNAIGVAVVDDVCSFVIGKEDGGTKAFGGYNTDLSTIGIMVTESENTAKIDFAGYTNTSKLIGKLGTDAAAATWCRTQFSNKGYLPAVGEWNLANSLKSDIDTMMTTIGGTAIMNSNYWASTLGDSSYKSWKLGWGNLLVTEYRSNPMRVHAFSPLYIPVTLALSSSDGTSIANRNIFIFDKTGESQTVTTDSTGKATANIAVGDVEIRVEGCRTLTKSVTLTAAMNRISVEICTPDPGIYAYYEDGTMKSYDDADSTAIGVAVVTSNCSFVIDKKYDSDYSFGTAMTKFGGYYKDLSGSGATITSDYANGAYIDFRGEANTVSLINALGGYTDSAGTTSAAAAEYCRKQFGGKGYLGSIGEWRAAYFNKTDVNSMISKIGGTAIKSGQGSSYPYWSSTLETNSYNAWMFSWIYGESYPNSRDSLHNVRAFCAL